MDIENKSRRAGHRRERVFYAASALMGLLLCSAALAQALTPPSGGPYVLKQQVIAGGGNRATGGSYVLTGTVAQANAGPAIGASYALNSGFHAAQIPGNQPEIIFSNGFEN